jgi:hypothetical protein
VNQSKNSTTGLSDGGYTYFASAIHNSVNENLTETRSYNVDLTAPVVNLLTPANNSWGTTLTQYFAVNNTDGIGLLNTTLYVWNSTNDEINTTSQNISGTVNLTNISVVLPYDDNYSWNYYVCECSYVDEHLCC